MIGFQFLINMFLKLSQAELKVLKELKIPMKHYSIKLYRFKSKNLWFKYKFQFWELSKSLVTILIPIPGKKGNHSKIDSLWFRFRNCASLESTHRKRHSPFALCWAATMILQAISRSRRIIILFTLLLMRCKLSRGTRRS